MKHSIMTYAIEKLKGKLFNLRLVKAKTRAWSCQVIGESSRDIPDDLLNQ